MFEYDVFVMTADHAQDFSCAMVDANAALDASGAKGWKLVSTHTHEGTAAPS